jgi:hypothetical protein
VVKNQEIQPKSGQSNRFWRRVKNPRRASGANFVLHFTAARPLSQFIDTDIAFFTYAYYAPTRPDPLVHA